MSDDTAATDDATTGDEPATAAEVDDLVAATAACDTSAPAVCGDGRCDPPEDVALCAEDCNVCGDGVVFGDEDCDNGINDDPGYVEDPAPDACREDCRAVATCGDGVRNGPEACDAGGVQTADCEADCRVPVCGDEQLNEGAGEGCDDGNGFVGDGCSPECVRERRVFVTGTAYPGNFDPGYDNPDGLYGVALADARCDAHAKAAGLPGVYRAWLSDFTTHPADRLDTTFEGLYRLPTPEAQIVARSWTDLVDGELDHPINVDEHGNWTLVFVWTATQTGGLLASIDHCLNWTETETVPEISSTVGHSGASDADWTMFGEYPCWTSRALYCFEDR